jgi:hypothetical protein
MKNQYFGDVNDYRKYGLLRILADGGYFRIGVCWMLTADDGRADGQFTNYLDAPHKWRYYDPLLYDQLRNWVKIENIRHVRHAATGQLVPGAQYFEELLTGPVVGRRAYFEMMSQQLASADLIFFDPDNGVEVKSVPMGHRNSSKYVFWKELENTFKRGQSVLVYQHFRREERKAFVGRRVAEFQSRLRVAGVYWFWTPQVVYFLAAQSHHAKIFRTRLQEVEARWKERSQILVGGRSEPGAAQ